MLLRKVHNTLLLPTKQHLVLYFHAIALKGVGVALPHLEKHVVEFSVRVCVCRVLVDPFHKAVHFFWGLLLLL